MWCVTKFALKPEYLTCLACMAVRYLRVYGCAQIHGSGDWPYHLASRLARELWALIKDVFPGLWCEEPTVTVLCNACGATLGTLSDLARRISEVEVVCAERGCGHSHQLQPFVGVAVGATTQAGAAWEYWFRHVGSLSIKHHRMRLLVDVADAVLQCAPVRPGVPRLWVPVPAASTPTRPGSPAPPDSPQLSSLSSGPRACNLRPVCAHCYCLHAMHGAGQNAAAVASFWGKVAISDSTEREQVTIWLSRVSQTLQLFTANQEDVLHTVSQAELERCRTDMLKLISRGRHVNLRSRRIDVNETLAQLFVALGDCGLHCVRSRELGDLYVCAEHMGFYNVREASLRMFEVKMRELQASLDESLANQRRMQAQIRDSEAAMARRQRGIHGHGHHPRMFVLALAPATTSAHALAGKVTCHLYLLCEHGGVPHPVKFRDTDEWRRVPVGIPNNTLRAMAPGLNVLRFVCQVASIVSGAASTLASLLGEEFGDRECVLCCAVVLRVVVCCWGRGMPDCPIDEPVACNCVACSFTKLSQPVDAAVGSALDGRDDVDSISSRLPLAEQERELRALQLRFEADRSTQNRTRLVRWRIVWSIALQ